MALMLVNQDRSPVCKRMPPRIFTLPAAEMAANGIGAMRAPGPQMAAHDDAGSSGSGATQKILVVDDNQDAADTLAMLLEFMGGAEVRVVNSGQAALDVMGGFHPDVVLLDIGMPGMDGHEVARRVRQQPQFASTRLVALTGWGQDEDRRRTQESGFDHHLTKPVDIASLQALLSSL
jgi:CheY-like chemotaxis protein